VIIGSRRYRWAAAVCTLVVLLALSCSRSGSGGEHTGSDLPVSPGLTGDVGPVPRSCDGVTVTTSDDVQEVIDAHPPGTTFCLAAGIYRLEAPLEPKDGDALIGDQGTVLNGSKVLTGWRKNGSVWSTTGFLPAAPGNQGECLESAPTCAYTEDVFVDKKRLNRVDSPSAVTAGTVYADYRSNVITIGDDPRDHLVEQAVAPSLVRALVDDVTVANLILEQAANEAQVGAVESRQAQPHRAGSGWRILQNEVRLNHGAGLGFADAATVTANFIHHQGQLGFGAWGAGSAVSNNEISFNGAAGYSPEWEAGGSKSWLTDHHTLTHNYVHDNWGPGLWADGGNMDTYYEDNKITDNWGAGIQHEISYDATIRHNQISGNGRRHKGWAWEAGIQIQSSGGKRLIEIAYNVVEDNANGIALIDSGNRAGDRPAPYGPHVVQNVWVHDNNITMSTGQTTGAVEDTGDPGIFTTNHNRFEANTYYLQSLTEPYFSWANADLDWSQWRTLGKGNDLNGRAELWRR
jgi:parallel beta-helix repeat protein